MLNPGFRDDSPGPIHNTFQMGIKTRTVSYSPSKYRRTNINEGVIKTPGPDQYSPKKPCLVEHPVSFTKGTRKNDE